MGKDSPTNLEVNPSFLTVSRDQRGQEDEGLVKISRGQSCFTTGEYQEQNRRLLKAAWLLTIFLQGEVIQW